MGELDCAQTLSNMKGRSLGTVRKFTAGACGIGRAAVRRPLVRRARPLCRRRQVESDDERRVQSAHGVDLVRCAAKSRHVAAQQTERLHRVGKQRLARVR